MLGFSWLELYWYGAAVMFLVALFISMVYFMSGGTDKVKRKAIANYGKLSESAYWNDAEYYYYLLGWLIPIVGPIAVGFLSIWGLPIYVVVFLAWLVSLMFKTDARETAVVDAMMKKGN